MRMLAIPIGWMIGIVAVICTGFAPDPYWEYLRQIPLPHPYPLKSVFWILIFMSIHTSLAFAILRPKSFQHSWERALMALLVSSGFFAFAALGAMHAPPAYIMYLWWLLAFWLVMFWLFISSAILALRRRLLS